MKANRNICAGAALLSLLLCGCEPASGEAPAGIAAVSAEPVVTNRATAGDSAPKFLPEEYPVSNGMKKSAVIAVLGEPKGVMSSGSRTILIYDGGNIELVNGSVTNLSPAFAESIRAARSNAARQSEFELRQKAKGLILFDDKWITVAEREQMLKHQRELDDAERLQQAKRKRQQEQYEAQSRSLTESQYRRMAVFDDAGRPVDHSDLVTSGKITIVDFYADWCGPCHQLAPYLDALVKNRDDIVLKKVNIEHWRSQIAEKYNVKSVPNVRVFDRKGRLVGPPNHSIDIIRRYVEEAEKRKY